MYRNTWSCVTSLALYMCSAKIFRETSALVLYCFATVHPKNTVNGRCASRNYSKLTMAKVTHAKWRISAGFLSPQKFAVLFTSDRCTVILSDTEYIILWKEWRMREAEYKIHREEWNVNKIVCIIVQSFHKDRTIILLNNLQL